MEDMKMQVWCARRKIKAKCIQIGNLQNKHIGQEWVMDG